MNWWTLLLGCVLVIWTFVEALWTTIWIDGNSAPLTSRLTTWTWKGFRFVDRSRNHRFLSLSGPFILFFTVAAWIFVLWTGWVLVFQSVPGALKDTGDGSPASLSGVIWYIGYCLFTVGNGDFIPQGSFWRIISGIVAFTGMLTVTLSITYLLQVLSAVVNKRNFASQVLSIGRSAEEMISAQWNGKEFGWIELQLASWSSLISTLTEQTLAYPILHYYHAARAEKSSAVALAVLDDALTFIAFGVKKQFQPEPAILLGIRQSIQNYLDTLQSAFIVSSKEVPRPPDLSRLKGAGIPTVDPEKFSGELERRQDRRRLLLGMIQNAAWEWPPLRKEEKA